MDSFSPQDMNVTSASIPSALLASEAENTAQQGLTFITESVITVFDGMETSHTAQVTSQISPACFPFLAPSRRLCQHVHALRFGVKYHSALRLSRHMVHLPHPGLKTSNGREKCLRMWVWDFVQGTIVLPVSAGVDDEMDEDISSWLTKGEIFFCLGFKTL